MIQFHLLQLIQNALFAVIGLWMGMNVRIVDIMHKLYSIKGYEGLYSITKNGKIWSHYGKGRWLKLYEDHEKYIITYLCKNKRVKTLRVHRLVAQTFIPNPENKAQINHKDCNPSNNNINNLEWATRIENMQHALRMGRLTRSKEQRKRMSEIRKGRKHSEETRRKISETLRRNVLILQGV